MFRWLISNFTKMLWKRLFVPFISVLTFLGLVGYVVLFKAFHKTWKQRPLFCLFLMEMTVVSLIHLFLRSTLLYLDFLDIWTPRDKGSCVALSYIASLLRLTLLHLILSLAGERHLASQRPGFHESIDAIQSGIAISVASGLLAVLMTSIPLLLGSIGSDCYHDNNNGQMTAWAVECILAVFAFVASCRCLCQHRRRVDYRNGTPARFQNIYSVFALGIFLSTASVCVSGMQLLFSIKTLHLSTQVLTASTVIENVSFALSPVVLFFGKPPFIKSIMPQWLHKTETRKQEKRTTQPDQPIPELNSDSVKYVVSGASVHATEKVDRRVIGNRWVFKKQECSKLSDRMANKTHRLDLSIHSCDYDTETTNLNRSCVHQRYPVRTSQDHSQSQRKYSICQSPQCLLMESLHSSDSNWSVTSKSLHTASDDNQRFVNPSLTTTIKECWIRNSLIRKSDTIRDFSVTSSSLTFSDISRHLRSDYIATGGGPFGNDIKYEGNLPGFISPNTQHGAERIKTSQGQPIYVIQERADSDMFDRNTHVYLGSLPRRIEGNK